MASIDGASNFGEDEAAYLEELLWSRFHSF
jgi:hypothetical protein